LKKLVKYVGNTGRRKGLTITADATVAALTSGACVEALTARLSARHEVGALTTTVVSKRGTCKRGDDQQLLMRTNVNAANTNEVARGLGEGAGLDKEAIGALDLEGVIATRHITLGPESEHSTREV